MKTHRAPGGASRRWSDTRALARPSAFVPAALPMFVACAAFAASEGGHREHGAHEHGRGTLEVAVEGEELVVELRMPAVNVVGFEHPPGTDAEREAVRQALARFSDPAAVLVPPPGAECEPERVEAGFPGMDHGDHHGHHEDEEHGHERNGHERGGHAHEEGGHGRAEGDGHGHGAGGHAQGKGHGHDEHHDGGPESGGSDTGMGAEIHSELRAVYRFHCHAPQRLDRIQVRVFELLQDAEEIEARVVTPTLQKATELHPGETVVDLSR